MSLPETCCGHTHHILPRGEAKVLRVRLWEAREQLGIKAAWWELPGVPRGRPTGHGYAAQGVPRMEPGWLPGMPSSGEGKRVLVEGPVGLPYVWGRGRGREGGASTGDHNFLSYQQGVSANLRQAAQPAFTTSAHQLHGFNLEGLTQAASWSHSKSSAQTLPAGAALLWG